MFRPREKSLIKSIIVIFFIVILLFLGLLYMAINNIGRPIVNAAEYTFDPDADVYQISIYDNGEIEVVTDPHYIQQLNNDTVIITNLDKDDLIRETIRKFK